MDSTRWSHIQDLFYKALSLPEPEQEAFLKSACGDDGEVLKEVTAMLAADRRKTSLLDRGLPDVAYRLVGSTVDAIPRQEIGPYRLKRVLGEGGMGVVWLAERSDTGNPVAIKFLPHAGLSPARQERFTREIRTLAKLKHSYIARFYDAGTLDDGTPWFVMEFVEGVRFTDYCQAPERTVEEQLQVFRMVCEAVQYAHRQGIIHRDLKPSNILVVADGTPRLLDFGIAKELRQFDEALELTRPELRFFSPGYAAPEWAHEGIVGLSTDVYSLGVILYEMLTGRLPFENPKLLPGKLDQGTSSPLPDKPSRVASGLTAAGRASNPAARLSRVVWNDLDDLCLKAIHLDPTQRYPSVEALLRDVDHFLNNEPLEARPPSLLYRTSKFVQRHRSAVLATTVACLLVACTVAVFTVRLIQSRAVAMAEAARTQRIQRFMLNLFQGGDKDAGPSADLRVITLIDRGVGGAQALSKEPAVQADLYQTLGTMYQKLGRFDRADALLQRSLQVRRRLREQDDSAEMKNLIALGLLRSEQGKFNEAEQLVSQALTHIQTRDPGNKPLLGEAESALGSVLVTGGKQAQSVEMLKKAIATIESTGGETTPEFAQTLGALADADMYLGRYEECELLNRRALAVDRRLYGERHPHIADDVGNLAQLQELRGNYAEAEQYERQALQIMQGWYGSDHPETARKMTTLASTLTYEAKYSESEDLLRQALRIMEKSYGSQHPRVAYAANALAGVELQEKKFKEAEEGDRRAMAIYRAAYGDADYRVAVTMGNLASVFSAEKRYGECERMLRDVVERFTKALGALNINTGVAQVRLGRTLLHEHRYKEAEEHTRAGYGILKDQTSSQTSYVQGALHDLAVEYAALNRPQDVERFNRELSMASASRKQTVSSK